MTDSSVASQPAPGGGDPNGAHANGAHAEDPQALVQRVHRLLTEHLNIDAPSPDTDIVDSGELDSFTMVELLATVEEQFGVEVPIETLDVDHFRSARSVAGLIAAQRAG